MREDATARITVRFRPSDVARIDAALDRAAKVSPYGYRPNRSTFIAAAIGAALKDGIGRRWPGEPGASDAIGPGASDTARAASDKPAADARKGRR